VVVLVHSDERTFLTDRGSSPALAVTPPGALADAAWLHTPAYSFAGDHIGGVADALLRECHAAGIPTSVDAASVSVLEAIGPEAFLRRCADLGCGVLFANEHEAALLGLPERGITAGIPIVVVKQGGDPTIVATPTERATVVPEPIHGRFDPTGAGDAFAAGFVVAHLAGATIADAARAANALAHTVLTTPRSSW
jgi:sugar/nucleoside kinase (ribokinase family)